MRAFSVAFLLVVAGSGFAQSSRVGESCDLSVPLVEQNEQEGRLDVSSWRGTDRFVSSSPAQRTSYGYDTDNTVVGVSWVYAVLGAHYAGKH
jgi:hypothetical protein